MNSVNGTEHLSLLEFPCDFPVKAMGNSEDGFEARVVELISAHVGDVPPERVRTRQSRNGRFVSVTVTIVAESREQLDAVYRSLTSCEQVLLVL